MVKYCFSYEAAVLSTFITSPMLSPPPERNLLFEFAFDFR